MDFINQALEYFTGPQGEYEPIDFRTHEDYSVCFASEKLGLLKLEEELNEENLKKYFKTQRGILLHKDQLYEVDLHKKPMTRLITKTSENSNYIDKLKQEFNQIKQQNHCVKTSKILLVDAFEQLTDVPLRQDNGIYGDRTLFYKLKNEFEDAIQGLDKESAMFKHAIQIQKEIIAIEKKQNLSPESDAYEEEEIQQLNQVLKRSIIAITPAPDTTSIEVYNANAAQLALLAKQLPGYSGMGWKILAGLLIMLSVSAISFGLLLAIPSGGASLSLSFLGFLGVNAILAAMTSAAAPLAATIGLSPAATAAMAGIGGGAATGIVAYKTQLNKELAKATTEMSAEITKSKNTR